MGEVRTALGFLTRIPVGRIEPYDPTMSRAAGYFPLIGALVAAVGAAVWWAASELLGGPAASVAAVLATVVVTGALHEDGLADTADGLWGGTTRERRLEIMRDSRLGTYGTLTLAGDLMLRVAILLPFGEGDLVDVARILVAGHVIGRAVPLVLTSVLPYAQREPHSGHATRPQLSPPSRRATVVAAATVGAAAIITAEWMAPVPLAVAALVAIAVRRLGRRRIDGVTGDLLGASVALTNLAVMATLAALIRGGNI